MLLARRNRSTLPSRAAVSTAPTPPAVPAAKIRPSGFWESLSNRRRFLDQLRLELDAAQGSYASLYSITHRLVLHRGAGGMLKYYNGSPAKAVVDVYRGVYDFKLWRFEVSPRNYWPALARGYRSGDAGAIGQVGEYLDFVVKAVEERVDRERPRETDLAARGALGLSTAVVRDVLGESHVSRLSHFGGIEYLLATLPDQASKAHAPSEADAKGEGAFANPRHRRAFLDQILALNLSPRDVTSHYRMSPAAMRAQGGQSLISLYHKSAASMISTEYPEHHWQPWSFRQSPRGWWEGLALPFAPPKNQSAPRDPIAECCVRLFIEELASKHGVKTPSDWYKLSSEQLGDGTLLRLASIGRLPAVLATLYPNYNWDSKLFASRAKRAVQSSLERRVDKLLPDK